MNAFTYVAQSVEGQPISGTIDAAAIEEAAGKLQSLQLRVIELKPAPASAKPRALKGDDFLAFNQQLASLAAAGLPLEHGLRLIADDMRCGGLSQTLKQIAGDMESGQSLPQSIEAHRKQFPPLYAGLVDAGIRSGNLSATLLNLARHMTLQRQLQATLWRAGAYPLMVLLSAFLVLVFMAFVMLPQFDSLFRNFHTSLPLLTRMVMALGFAIRSHAFWIGLAIVIVALVIIHQLLRSTHVALLEQFNISLPLIGPVLERSLIARWCDLVRLGVEAGLDLPTAIQMAADATASQQARNDAKAMVEQLAAGRPLHQIPRGKLIPLTVTRSMALAAERNELPSVLGTLSEMYQQQAQSRLDALSGVLTPLLLLLVGAVIAVLALAMIAPFLQILQAVSGPGSKF